MGKQQQASKFTQNASTVSASKLLQTRPLQAESQASEQQTPQSQAESESTSKGFDLTTAKSLTGGDSSVPALGQPLQAKLTIGKPDDKYEQEADRVAQNVVQRINSPQSEPAPQDETVQRHTDEDELQMKPMLRRQAVLGGGDASSELESSINRAKGSGQALDPNLQQSMGQSMGADFSGVKVHTDAQADELNRSIQAKAFTTGEDVFFRKGEYNPGSQSGQELIAHELTHVVQQNGSAIQRSDALQNQENQLASVGEKSTQGVIQRAINPLSQTARDTFLETYPHAGDLVQGIDVTSTNETQVLDDLVNNYKDLSKSKFTYDMTPTTPQDFLKGSMLSGDCSTLSKSFEMIAKGYFGVSGISTETKGNFGIAGGGAVLDKGGATGNVNDNGVDGAHWAFTSHTWVVGPDRDRDMLFKGATVDQSGWLDATGNEGKEDGIDYKEYAGLGGGRVYTYRNVTSKLGNRYTLDLDTAKGAAEEDKQEMLKLYDPNAKKKKKGGCFITTACVKAKGLADDCEELTILRQFRDNYMYSVSHGSDMISEYYKIAPEIVDRISKLPDGKRIFVELYDQVVKSVNLVKAGKNEAAMQNYISIVRDLKNRYL